MDQTVAELEVSPALRIRRVGAKLSETTFYALNRHEVSFLEVLDFARTASWDQINAVAPPEDGYQSWIAPFKFQALRNPGAPSAELERLITSVAAINISSARVSVEELADLERTMRKVTAEDVRTLVSGDTWLTNFLLNVWEYVQGVSELTTYPWNVTLPVADLCNARCTFCTSWLDGRALVKLEQVRSFSDVIGNAQQIGLIGHGEPLAHPQFDKICDIIAEHMDRRAAIYTITNGVYLQKWSDLIDKVNLRSFSISLNAASPRTHDEVMGLGPDAFDKIVDAIRGILARNGLERRFRTQVYITMVVTQQNIHEVADFVRLGNELGVEGVWLRSLLPQSTLIPGLNYHVLAPNLHPEFERHRAEAVAAIRESKVEVQAEPHMWGQEVLTGPLKAEVISNPPELVSRENALKDRELRRRNEGDYDAERLIRRGRAADSSKYSRVDWFPDGARVQTAAQPWSYALTAPVTWPDDISFTEGRVRLNVKEVAGKPGFGLLDTASNSWVSRASLDADGEVELTFSAGHGPLQLVIENWSEQGASSAVVSDAAVTVGSDNAAWTGAVPLATGAVHNPLDPLDDGTNPFNRTPRFACKAVYYNLYLNELYFRIVPCCYMTVVPGFEEIRFDGSVPFMDAWNAPALVELRGRLLNGPLFGACKKCAETW
jgi:pyruvate-formate lyase-activating enzyme